MERSMARFDETNPFFRPLWRRAVIVVFCLGWATFELVSGALFWGGLFAAAGLYLLWVLIINYFPASDSTDADRPDDPTP